MRELLSKLPKIDELLADDELLSYKKAVTYNRFLSVLRKAVEQTRAGIISGEITQKSGELYELVRQNCLSMLSVEASEAFQTVINATGIIIHTNLGRSPLSKFAALKVYESVSSYNNLEFSTISGKRRGRLTHIEAMICDLTGAEAALVVNNNAAAVFLALNSLASNKQVVLSRGEMVEIGDSFRVSDIIAQSGCEVVEVGTTNKTKISDYEAALNEHTGVLLKVHTSNFKIVGFAESVAPAELARLSMKHGIVTIEDMGSGVLIDLSQYGLARERTAQAAIAEGIDIITFSGDKMLGGPQAGIIAGKRSLIERMKKNQLLRCLRLDKMSLAALEATLSQYFSRETLRDIPIFKSMLISPEELKIKAEQLLSELYGIRLFSFEIKQHDAYIGGGSLPDERLESLGIHVSSPRIKPNDLAASLRQSTTPVIATVSGDMLILDLRTIDESEFTGIKNALMEISRNLNISGGIK